MSIPVETLFETGGLELVENALIQKVISSLKFIKDTSLSVFSGLTPGRGKAP